MKYGNDYTYPVWAECLGWLMTLASLVPVVIYPVYYLLRQEGTFMEVIASR